MKRCRQWTPHMEIIKFATRNDHFWSEKLKNSILLLTFWPPHAQGGCLDEFLWIDCQGWPTMARWICILQIRHQTFTDWLRKGPKPKLDAPSYEVNSTTKTSTTIKGILPCDLSHLDALWLHDPSKRPKTPILIRFLSICHDVYTFLMIFIKNLVFIYGPRTLIINFRIF